MTYTLNVKETKNSAGKFHYTVTDEEGKIISERKSNRSYVACSISGEYYFGRNDLAQKFQAKNPGIKLAYLKNETT